ncbi:prepilin-type N-terminal cleavage/methylation domain-containing protein [Gracilimonas sp.]|uniref:prepilin-type N-terminal cleavage/methylation domain-containing protein n=1 Tax=Gracilimonas sp. TaxID=1974203 RepID=UPI003BA880DA
MIKEEDGYTLVETLVALTILLAVLVPAAMFIGVAGGNTLAKDKIASFNLAKNAMEEALITQSDKSFVLLKDSKWWVKTDISQESEHLYSIGVSVFKEDTLRSPSVTLHTKRLWYDM